MSATTPPEGCGFEHHDLADIGGEGAPLPSILRRDDGSFLFYRDALNLLSSEPGEGKTTIALEAAREVAQSGGEVVILDYEDTPLTARDRLVALGATPADLTRIYYFQATGPLTAVGIAWLESAAASAALVVIDSFAEALGAAGLNEDSAGDVARWIANVPRRFARAGAGVLLLDHVTKNEKDRGHWPRGSGHKLAAVDGIAYSVKTEVPFSRSSSGWASLVIAKDRRGWVGPARACAAVVHFEVADGSLCQVRCEQPGDDTAFSQKDDSRLSAEDVALALQVDGGEWASLQAASESLGRSSLHTGQALRRAKDAGLIEEVAGAKGARRFVLASHPPLTGHDVWPDGEVGETW
jgi:hypothetical protein